MRTPITYYGGKQTMLPHILPLIPNHEVYTEAFCGGAAVFFAKRPAPAEVINDLNLELVNFYNVVQSDFSSLKREIDSTLHSRDVHTHAQHIMQYPSFFSPVQRAWAVWVCSKMSFASKLDGTFGYDFAGGVPKKVRCAKQDFTAEMCHRLERVTIESRDALKVIETYDSPNTFHFVDPPYINSDCGHYTDMFGSREMTALLDLLTEVQGKFMLTMFPYDEIEEYANRHGWIIHRIERTISASKTSRRKQEEWMVCNYQASEGVRSLFD